MKTIVHLITDEKFIDKMIVDFETYSGCSNVYIQIAQQSKIFKFVRSPLAIRMTVEEFETIYLCQKGACDMIILHCLHSFPITRIWKIPKRIKIVWLAWGYDLYQTPFRPLIKINNLYGNLTSSLVKKLETKCQKIFYRKAYDWIIYLRWYIYCKLATMRIDYFSGVSEYEYEMMNKSVFFRAEKLVFNYSIDLLSKLSVADSGYSESKGRLWIGNSATPTNNHQEILSFLKSKNVTIEHIMVPLSYGDDSYGKLVAKTGIEMFGADVFTPITDFMPIEEYIEHMQKCSIAIFGTMRQQSMGNISIALHLGLKVFFFRESPLYTHFKQKGFLVFTIEEDLCREIGNGSMPSDAMQLNREFIAHWHSPQTMKRNLENLVSQI